MDFSTPEPKREWKSIGRAVLCGGLFGLKVLAVAAILFGIGLSGNLAYKKLSASTYFCLKELKVRGTKRIPPSEITRLVESNTGKNIFTLDLEAMEKAVAGHPWLKGVKAHRELPHTIAFDIVEQNAKALLLIGHLYLVNEEGQVFKRATMEEAEGLAVITGIDRLAFLNDPRATKERISRGLSAMDRFRRTGRPVVSEIHLDDRDDISIYIKQGVALRMGKNVSEERLDRFDRVWAALGPETSRARMVFLDNELRADRVIVRALSNQ
jgi:cell division protein FtsQ